MDFKDYLAFEEKLEKGALQDFPDCQVKMVNQVPGGLQEETAFRDNKARKVHKEFAVALENLANRDWQDRQDPLVHPVLQTNLWRMTRTVWRLY